MLSLSPFYTGLGLGLFIGAFIGLIIAALLGMAGRQQDDEIRQLAYRSGYAACLAKVRPFVPDFKPRHLYEDLL